MNKLSMRRLFLILFIFTLAVSSAHGQIFHKNASRKAEKGLFGKSLNKKKEIKVKEPRSVVRAKKKQEANERKLKKNYAAFVKRSQKRTIEIQTPEVQERMKQNKKNLELRDKTKKKRSRISNKSAGRKYN
jgi:predicted metal-dependent hydrolase